jgi:hypothetical protein
MNNGNISQKKAGITIVIPKTIQTSEKRLLLGIKWVIS